MGGDGPFEEEVLDVVLHGKTAGAFGVVPVEFDAGKTVAGPFLGDIVVLEEDVAKMDAWILPTYLMPNSTRIKQTRMGRHLWHHRPVVVGHW